MASLQERNGSYRILFFYHGKVHSFTLGKVKQDEAESKTRQVDNLRMRLKQKRLVLPERTDIASFIEHDGKPPDAGPTLPAAPRQAVTLGILKERYLSAYANSAYANGTIEANSLDTCRLHLSHFCRVLGAGLPLKVEDDAGTALLRRAQVHLMDERKYTPSHDRRVFRDGGGAG